MSSNNQSSYKFKEFRLDVAERLLLRADASVPLMPKMFDVLTLFIVRELHLDGEPLIGARPRGIVQVRVFRGKCTCGQIDIAEEE